METKLHQNMENGKLESGWE